jgi:hypothetical protein
LFFHLDDEGDKINFETDQEVKAMFVHFRKQLLKDVAIVETEGFS